MIFKIGGKADKLCEKGWALYRLKQYDEALAMYDEALKIKPRHKDAWNNKGYILHALKRYEEAIICYDHALKINPKSQFAWNSKGKLLNDLKRYEEAIICYDHALKIDPKDELALDNKNQTLKMVQKQNSENLTEQMTQTRAELKVGDVLGGEFEIRKIIGKGGMGSVYVAYGKKVWMEMVALKSFKEVSSWDRKAREALKQEAYTWVKLEKHNNIVEAKTIEEFHGKIYVVMEYIDGGDLEELMKEINLDITQSIDYSIQFCNGMEYAAGTMKMVHRDIKAGNILITKDNILKITDFGVATTSYQGDYSGMTLPYASPEQCREIMGEKVMVDTRADIYSFGVVLYEMLTGKLPFHGITRKDYISQHLNIDPELPSTLNSKIPSKLDDIVKKCLNKDPNARYHNFGMLKEELLKLYRKHTGNDYVMPDRSRELDEWELNNKGYALNQLQRSAEAISCFDQALKINPQHEFSWINKGIALFDMQRYDEAIACYDKAIKIDPQSSFPWNNKGNTYLAMHRYAEAKTSFDNALKIDPEDDAIWSNKGEALRNLQLYLEAISCFDKAIDINPQYEYAWNNKGHVLYTLERYEEAIICYDQAIEINPQYLLAWNNKGAALEDLHRSADAIACYDQTLKIDPQNEYAWSNKGVLFFNLGDWRRAIQCWDQALILNPNDSEARQNRELALRNLRGY